MSEKNYDKEIEKKAADIVGELEKKEPKKRKKKLTSREILKLEAYAVGIFFWVIFAFYGAYYLVSWLAGQFWYEEAVTPVGTLVMTAIVYTTALIITVSGPILVAQLLKNKRWMKEAATSREELGVKGLPTWADIGLGIVGMIVTLFGGAILLGLMTNFGWFDLEQTQDLPFATSIIGLDRVWAFVALVVVAPIAEELMFRGWMYGKLRKKLPSTVGMVASILLVSVLFGLMHGQWNVGITVGFMSIIMCVMREMTGTIWAGIILHMLKNGIAFVALFLPWLVGA